MLVTPALRVALYYYSRHYPPGIDIEGFTLTRLDSIAIGCCLALLATSPRWGHRFRVTPKSAFWLFVAGIGLLVVLGAMPFLSGRYKIIGYYSMSLSNSVVSLVMAGIIWSAANTGNGLPGRILNSRPFQVIGILSYSLYLWQQPFLSPYRTGWAFSWPINVGMAFLAAVLSYLCVESPFLRLKDRLGHSYRKAGARV